MHRRTLLAAVATLSVLRISAAWPQDDKAYETKLQRQAKALPAIRAAIAAATGYDEASVEVTPGRHQLFVKLVNSKLADGNNAARIDEANVISSAVGQEIATRPDFNDVETLHVDYIMRDNHGGAAETVQAIDFRRDSEGRFRHQVS
jgi:hypothetical protein